MVIRFLLLVLFIALSGCLKESDTIYVFLSQNQGKPVMKVNGNVVNDFDSLGDRLGYFFNDKKDVSLYILFSDGVALSDAENVIGVAQAIGYSNIKLYSISMKTEKMQKINRSNPEPFSDNILKIIGEK